MTTETWTKEEREKAAAGDVFGRLLQATQGLCAESGDIRARLANSIVAIVPLKVEDFPTELQESYATLRAKVPAHDAIKRMSEPEASKIAEEILELLVRVTELKGPY